MTHDRRKEYRFPTINVVRVASKGPDSQYTVFPILLRDKSHSGFGGTYVGPDELIKDNDFYLIDDIQSLKKLRVAWVDSADYHVQSVGFHILQN